jgi:lysophospholipase L1-like esterase
VIGVLGCIAAVALTLPGAASATAARTANPCASGPVTTPLVANATRLGVIDLHFFGALGAPVDFFECVGDRAVALGRRSSLPGTLTSLFAATSWRCVRLARDFAATATLPDGSSARGTGSIRTRSCASRFELTVPRHVAPGQAARVRIRDRWRVGGARTKLCVARPGGRLRCRSLIFKSGATRSRVFQLSKRGLWRVELRVPGHRTRASIAVGVQPAVRKAPPPRVLATGDSTMDGLDSFLSDQLGDDADVVSSVEPGLAISRADAFQPMAIKDVKRLRPATTVVSIGANEGWSMRTADGAIHECCDAQWVDEYARRVRLTMVTFGRRVFWCTIIAQRDPRRVPIVAAVNAGILQAAQGLADVHVIRLDLLFSPDGYRETIRYRGRDVDVREPDGVHLSVAGAEIAAREVVKAIRATP